MSWVVQLGSETAAMFLSSRAKCVPCDQHVTTAGACAQPGLHVQRFDLSGTVHAMLWSKAHQSSIHLVQQCISWLSQMQ